MHHFRSTLRIALGLAVAAPAASVAPAGAAPGVSPITDLHARGQLSFRVNTTVLTQIDGDSATLRVGPGGTVPQTVKAQSLPAWGQPHLGTDAARKPVVVYPHCTTTAMDSCSLRVYSVLTGKDAAIPGIGRQEVGEIEGVMDRGALAFTRWTANAAPVALALDGHGDGRTTLSYKAVGKAEHTITANGASSSPSTAAGSCKCATPIRPSAPAGVPASSCCASTASASPSPSPSTAAG